MEFDCMCAYPLWASSRVCDTDTGTCQGNCLLNPGICQPGTFNWDLTKEPKEPSANMCECADGYVMVIDPVGIPRCVTERTASYYSDIDVVTDIQGGQPKIPLDNAPMRVAGLFTCPTQTGIAQKYTQCGTGNNATCCSLPNATCCGSIEGQEFCCPSDYPVCDMNNKRCLKSSIECDSTETKCSQGCCNTTGGTCCSDGSMCCPASFPHCDPTMPYCNPSATLLVDASSGSIVEGDHSQCPHGICPIPDGVCCGNVMNGQQYCCPPDYPICALGTDGPMCRKPN